MTDPTTPQLPRARGALWLCFRLLDVVGFLLVPPDFTAEWKKEWRAELWQQSRAQRGYSKLALPLRCLGAIPDALSLWPWSIEILMNDFRYAARILRRQGGFAFASIVTLALGIGATSAIFSVVNGVLLRELPYHQPDELVRVWSVNRSQGFLEAWTSRPDFEDWQRQNTSFTHLGAYSLVPPGLTVTNGGEPERLVTAFVSDGFFETLGVNAARGRTLVANEHRDGYNRVVVISDALWRRRFGADSAFADRTIVVDGEPFAIVGVMPPGFDFPTPRVEAWVPLSLVGANMIPRVRDAHWLSVIGRLREGISINAARSQMTGLASALAKQWGQSRKGWNEAQVLPLREPMVRAARPALIAFLVAAVLVLAIACVNVANLLLARAVTREREMAVRVALGAGRRRLIHQLLAESLLLAAFGGALGLIIAMKSIPVLVSLSAGAIPRAEAIGTDWRVLLFTIATSIGSGILFGLVPAWRAGRSDLRRALTDGGRGATSGRSTHRIRAALVISEVAVALVLTVTAGLTLKSFSRLVSVDPGFDATHTLAVRFSIRTARFPTSAEYLQFYRDAEERVRGLPGVVAVGGAKTAPLFGGGEPYPFTIAGRAPLPRGAEPTAGLHPVTPGYFDAIGMRIIRGRGFSSHDDERAAKVMIVSEEMARRSWPGANPIGAIVKYGPEEATVVGVVSGVRQTSMDSLPAREMYVPVYQNARVGVTLIVRTSGDPVMLAQGVRDALHSLDPELAIASVVPMSAVVATSVQRPRFVMFLLATFGVIALILAAIGLYGVISQSARQRTHEIGIRVALGAGRGRVIGQIVREGMQLAGIGIIIGIGVSLAATRLLSTQLYGVTATDPATFATIALLLATVAFVASYLPASRASRVDPVIAMRGE